MANEVEVRPQAGKQWDFLSSSADITIYGGQAGGGKTWALLLEPTRHVHKPDFGAVIFRQTYRQIRQEGGMWDESSKIYPHFHAKGYTGGNYWRFPSGAKVTFSYLGTEDDKYSYDGAQIPLICFDQLEQFTESMFFYMLSRNRSTCGVKPYLRATCNPMPDSWLARFLSWWIDPDTGYADESRSGVVRYMLRINEEIIWGSTKGALVKQYKRQLQSALADTRLVEAEDLIKSVTFIPASVYDNKILLETNPEYLANLLSLEYIERERLLKGNWNVKAEAGTLFNRSWFPIRRRVRAGGVLCRYWDLAASEPSKRNEDPDYTAGTLVRYSVGKYYIEDLNTFRETAARSDEIMLNVTQQDAILAKRQKMPYLVRIEQEPGASGKREANRLVGLLGLYADDIGSDRVTGSKVDRARGLSSQAEVGNVVLVEADWNERWLNHMHNQPDFPHHDIMDTASGAYNTLRDYLQAQEFKGTVARVEPKQRKGDNGRRPEPMRSIRYLGNRSFPFSAGRYNWMVTPGWEREIEAPLAEEIVGRFGQFFEYKE